jgi:hypothetical protein
VIAASLGKDGLCGGSTPELRVDESQVSSFAAMIFFSALLMVVSRLLLSW